MRKFSIFNFQFSINEKGITLIEVLVGTFLVLLVFMGIFGAYQLGIKVVGQSKNKIIATEIANGEIEKIRNLPYQSIGVIGSFPDGVLEGSKIITRNNIDFIVETRMDYVIDPADGISPPEDGCPNDYKRAEVKVSWSGVLSGDLKLVIDVVPLNLSQECAETGGIFLVSVFDAYGLMVPSPLIEIKEPETDVLIKNATPIEGRHFFSLPAGIYKIEVSKTDYSSERTYGINEIAIPQKPHLIVLEGQLTENSFSIDKLSSFSVETLSPWGLGYFSDSFLNENKISELLELVVSGGQVQLATDDVGYKEAGFLASVAIAPDNLIIWKDFSFNDLEEAETQISYNVLYFDGENWVLIPDTDLSGNSTGFMVSPVDLSGLDVNNYSQLKVKANFSTTNPEKTPILYDWQVSWKNSQATPIANISFNLQGAKLIGKDGDEQPVYKYSQNHTTGGDGRTNIPNLEWDSYTFFINPAIGLKLEDTEPSPQPIGLNPETSLTVILYLKAQNSLLVAVQNIETGEPIFSANVRLYNDSGFDIVQYTDEKGETYFIPLEADTYTIEVQASGYSNYSSAVSVSGDETKIINLEQIE
ncbi:MAG: carboxypeptidase regulatory-like domain-containing protein [Candidatus Nealsonbacteria bacterium]|nr:carboxypeptidase regulatory-like domain-containing protein [Candidatus Nealsonbacteria bacterium]